MLINVGAKQVSDKIGILQGTPPQKKIQNLDGKSD